MQNSDESVAALCSALLPSQSLSPLASDARAGSPHPHLPSVSFPLSHLPTGVPLPIAEQGGAFSSTYPASAASLAFSLGSGSLMNWTTRGFGDAFVARASAQGSLQWAQQLGGPGEDAALGVAFEGATVAAGAVYLAGRFSPAGQSGTYERVRRNGTPESSSLV